MLDNLLLKYWWIGILLIVVSGFLCSLFVAVLEIGVYWRVFQLLGELLK